MNKDVYKADKLGLSTCGKYNKMKKRLRSKARRKEEKEKVNEYQ